MFLQEPPVEDDNQGAPPPTEGSPFLPPPADAPPANDKLSKKEQEKRDKEEKKRLEKEKKEAEKRAKEDEKRRKEQEKAILKNDSPKKQDTPSKARQQPPAQKPSRNMQAANVVMLDGTRQSFQVDVSYGRKMFNPASPINPKSLSF